MKVYATRFEFDAKTGLKQLVIATQRWLADVRRFGRGIGDMDLLTPWHGKAEGRDGCLVTSDTFEAGGTRLWACRFSHADRDYADRRWTTHIGARLTEQGGVCSVFLDLESTGSTVTMQRFTTSRPQIVLDLLEAIGEESLHDIPTGIRTVRSKQLEDFTKFIFDPDRKLPIILVTTSLQSERPLITPTRLGSLLAAMAYVYQFDDKFTGMDFSKKWATSGLFGMGPLASIGQSTQTTTRPTDIAGGCRGISKNFGELVNPKAEFSATFAVMRA